MELAAITREEFAGKTWRRPSNYTFAAQSNILPVTVAELAKLVPAMPLGFVKTDSGFRFVAITSLQSGINLFVAPDGNWIGDYIPATVRAYPFQLVKPQDREESVLCIDTSTGLLGGAGQGEAFFDGDEPTQAIRDILNLLSETEQSRVVTQRLVDVLQSAGLIQPWMLNLQQGDKAVPVEGLFRIDEAALNALPNDDFIALRKAGALALAYGQLFSMNQLSVLPKAAEVGARIGAQLQAKASSQAVSADIGFLFPKGETIKFS